MERLQENWMQNRQILLANVHGSHSYNKGVDMQNIEIIMSVYISNQMSKGYNLKISTDKTKIMAFKGKR